MKTPSSISRQLRGSTLLVALWALLLLSSVVFAWARWIDRRLDAHREEALGLEAYALALSGVALAEHPNVTRGASQLQAEMGHERSYNATVTGESGRINLLYLLRDEHPIRRQYLNDYLTAHGLTLEEREAFVDGILDWMDADNLKRNRGAEEEGDYKPTNRPITSLEELLLIRGTAPLMAANPEWRDDFTLHSPGPLDLQSAPERLIAHLPNVSEDTARAFVEYRRGSDGIDGTADDPQIQNLRAALEQMGIASIEEMQLLFTMVRFGEPTIRVRSVGRAGNVDRQIEVIARKVDGQNKPTTLIRIEP